MIKWILSRHINESHKDSRDEIIIYMIDNVISARRWLFKSFTTKDFPSWLEKGGFISDINPEHLREGHWTLYKMSGFQEHGADLLAICRDIKGELCGSGEGAYCHPEKMAIDYMILKEHIKHWKIDQSEYAFYDQAVLGLLIATIQLVEKSSWKEGILPYIREWSELPE